MNYCRMTIREFEKEFQVFKLKREQVGGYATDMAAKRFSWTVSSIAKPMFTGSYSECLDFIKSNGAEYMTEHGIPC